MSPALEAAVRLHDYIRANTGPTDEWPLQIRSKDQAVIEQLDALLSEFREAVMKERSCPSTDKT